MNAHGAKFDASGAMLKSLSADPSLGSERLGTPLERLGTPWNALGTTWNALVMELALRVSPALHWRSRGELMDRLMGRLMDRLMHGADESKHRCSCTLLHVTSYGDFQSAFDFIPRSDFRPNPPDSRIRLMISRNLLITLRIRLIVSQNPFPADGTPFLFDFGR